jgi:hydroxyacylglutathione hydrolase/adenylyltransferase/sulfurtransferase
MQLAAEAETLDRERPVLFYCRVGSRSVMAASAFRRAGFDAYSVDGGLTEWDRRGFPLEPADGTVADH